jgi:hypothetical protein
MESFNRFAKEDLSKACVGVPAMGVGAAVAASVASGAAASALSEAHGNSSFPVMGARGAALGCVNAFLLFQIL